MASFKSLIGSLLIIAAAFELAAAQTTHVVGDSDGWGVPQGGAQLYSTWAASQTFVLGDTLQFNFNRGHDVARVSKADFDSCSGSNPLEMITTGPATVPISSSGDHYYICTVTGHCNAGQKLMITIAASTSPAPQSGADAPTSAPPPTTGTPSPPSSASSLGAGFGVAVALLPFFL